MKILKIILTALFLFVLNCGVAQTVLQVPRNIQKSYTNGTRNKNGSPGKHYWQNTEDYKVKIGFDPATRKLSGKVSIDFTNNSPDTGDSDECDHSIPAQADHPFRAKLTRAFRGKLTTPHA